MIDMYDGIRSRPDSIEAKIGDTERPDSIEYSCGCQATGLPGFLPPYCPEHVGTPYTVTRPAAFTEASVTDTDSFQVEFLRRFPSLSYEFIQAMSDIGNYGLEKYGDRSMEAKFKRGDFSRCERTTRRAIAEHSATHNQEFIDGILHDKFGTQKHQLAAAAFNPMMEFRFSRLEREVTP